MRRRKLMTGLGLFTTATLITLGREAWVMDGDSTATPPKLIVFLLRGGIDGLTVVAPYQEPEYYNSRPTLAIPKPGKIDGLIDLDGYFGLHPALGPLMPLWRNQSLAFVHACGSPDPTRSHFQAQDYMENGTPGVANTSTGWLNRLLSLISSHNPTQALNLGVTTPLILKGSESVVNLTPRNPQRMVKNRTSRGAIAAAFDQLYQGNDPLSLAYQQGREAQAILLEDLTREMDQASRNAPIASNLSGNMYQLLQLMQGQAATQIAFIPVGGWDTHINQHRILPQSLQSLAESLEILTRELGVDYKNTLIVVMSEFGRTVKENGNRGTDHGHGNVMWLLGGNVSGGRVYGDWLGLEESQLYEQRDLPVTTDFRSVLATSLSQHFQLNRQQVQQVFPQYSPEMNLL